MLGQLPALGAGAGPTSAGGRDRLTQWIDARYLPYTRPSDKFWDLHSPGKLL